MKQLDYSDAHPFENLLKNERTAGNKLTFAFRRYLDAELDYVKHKIYFRDGPLMSKKEYASKTKVLEAGCGSGRLLRELAFFVSEIVGVDHSYAQIEAAEHMIKQNKLTNARAIYADINDMPFEDGYFDISLSAFGTFGNHHHDKFAVLKEMRRVTKSKGRVLLSVYGENAAEFQKELYDSLGVESRVLGDFTIYTFPDGTGSMAERFSQNKLRKLFADSGFNNFKIEGLGEFGYMCDLKK